MSDVVFLAIGIVFVALSLAVARSKDLSDATWESARKRRLVASGISEQRFRVMVKAGWYSMAALSAVIVLVTAVDLLSG